MNKRGLLLFIFIFFLGFVFAIIFTQGQKKSGAPTVPRPTLPSVLRPEFPNLPIKNIDYVAPIGQSFAHELSHYSSETENPEFTSRLIASRLGFSGNPNILPDISGNRYVWSENKKTLSIGGKVPNLTYISEKPVSKKLNASFAEKSEEESVRFLEKSLSIGNKGYIVKLYETAYLQPTGTAPNYIYDPNQATVGQLSFRLELPDGPVVPLYAGAPWAQIKLNADFEILEVNVFVPPIVKKSNDPMTIILYDDAASRLTSGQGVLTSYKTTETNHLGYEPISFNTSVIEKVELGYLYAPNNPLLLPIFLFSGAAKDPGSGKTISTTTVVSALP